MKGCGWFSIVAVPLGRCGLPLSEMMFLLEKKKTFHHPHYRFMKLLLPNCVILIISDEIQSKAQYLRCYDLLEIQVWRQGNSLSG